MTSKKKKKDYLEALAVKFAKFKMTIGRRLVHFEGNFYEFTGCSYRKLNREDLSVELTGWLQTKSGMQIAVTRSLVADVIINLVPKVLLRSNQKPPFKIDSGESLPHLIVTKNRFIKLSPKGIGYDIDLIQPSHEVFITGELSYDYDPTAKCPTWDQFLKRVQPNEKHRQLLQEWFGLNLIYSTEFQRFLLLSGSGANGKTVVAVVLGCLVGRENVSSVSLESMTIERTFPLAAMDGKLANIVTEMSEINKSAEGVLKQLVSGDPINVEKKHRDPFVMYPTARLTFATNVLPRFNDRSDGLWRRLLILPFNVQIPVKDQNKRLANPAWWEKSGELPGILNWAVEGLKNLLARERFEEPEASKVCKSELMADCNHARVFLETFCEPKKGRQCPLVFFTNSIKIGL